MPASPRSAASPPYLPVGWARLIHCRRSSCRRWGRPKHETQGAQRTHPRRGPVALSWLGDSGALRAPLAALGGRRPLAVGADLRPGPVDDEGLAALFDRLGFGPALRRQVAALTDAG